MKYLKLFENYSATQAATSLTGEYVAPTGDWDAMHSFQTRKKDGFGGRVHEKIDNLLKGFYETTGKNPEIKKLTITMDESTWKVSWAVEIGESTDGKAWIGITSRGGAGPNVGPFASSKRAQNQIDKRLKDLPKELGDPNVETKLVLDFQHDSKSGRTHVRQIFYAYTNPQKYPPKQKTGGQLMISR